MNTPVITIATLMAGRFYSLDAYFYGLENIRYPRELLDYLCLTNSDNPDFKKIARDRVNALNGFRSKRFIETDVVAPTESSFIERGEHSGEHAEVIALLYNSLYPHIESDYFLFLEDDIIAPSNALEGLLECWDDPQVGYACGAVMDRHAPRLFAWDVGVKGTFPKEDACQERQFYAKSVRKPYGKSEIGLGHFGLTLLCRRISEQFQKPIFRPSSSLLGAGALIGCDIVYCLELMQLHGGLKRICNFDVRAHHMDTQGRIH